MHITEIFLHEVPPISDIVLELDKRVNLFIGANASGKSTILRAIEYVYSPKANHPLSCITYPNFHWKDEWTFEQDRFRQFAEGESPFCWLPVSDDWPRNNPKPIDGDQAHREPIWNTVPLLFIPATRLGLPLHPKGWWDRESSEHRERTKTWEGQTEVTNLLGIDSSAGSVVFNAQQLKDTIDSLWLEYSVDNKMRHSLAYALHLGYSCARSICDEVVTGYSMQAYVEATDDDMVHIEDTLAHPNMGIGTSDGISGTPLYVGTLSSGTQGTLLWIWTLVLKMAHHYHWEEGWEQEPAILLIDEIENHLHPTWQRRVIPTLLKQFPKLQIFATTHSPFVVAGLKAGQVHLLERGRAGAVLATTNTEDVVGWTADEVLRNLMGVKDPTDDETARAAKELRRLRNQDPLTDRQAEERRQQRMRELRQRVNRDLLAGGPMAAQRERFEERFGEALEKYRKSQSLDQDRG